MADPSASPYEIQWVPLKEVTPRQRRLSVHLDFDGHTHEMCVVLHLPLGLLKIYPREPAIVKLLKEMV